MAYSNETISRKTKSADKFRPTYRAIERLMPGKTTLVGPNMTNWRAKTYRYRRSVGRTPRR